MNYIFSFTYLFYYHDLRLKSTMKRKSGSYRFQEALETVAFSARSARWPLFQNLCRIPRVLPLYAAWVKPEADPPSA
jgi:hypothetical protein